MHRDDDPDFDCDFVFDLNCLELFETTPATRPADEELEQELALDGGLGDRIARLARLAPRSKA